MGTISIYLSDTELVQLAAYARTFNYKSGEYAKRLIRRGMSEDKGRVERIRQGWEALSARVEQRLLAETQQGSAVSAQANSQRANEEAGRSHA
jgi:type VI protein secretion system component VasA